MIDDNTVIPLYPVTSPGLGTRAVGFVRSGDQVAARDEHGDLVWEADLGPGSLFGGFDFDDDGVPDLGLVRSEDTGTPCGMQTIIRTRLDVARASNGEVFPLTADLGAICWNFSGTIYPTVQWTDLDVLFGAGSSVLATAPYYAQAGSFWQFDGSGFDEIGTFVYPSVLARAGWSTPTRRSSTRPRRLASRSTSTPADGGTFTSRCPARRRTP